MGKTDSASWMDNGTTIAHVSHIGFGAPAMIATLIVAFFQTIPPIIAEMSDFSWLLTIGLGALGTAIIAFLGGFLGWKIKWWSASTKAEAERRKMLTDATEADSTIAIRGQRAEIEIIKEASKIAMEMMRDEVKDVREAVEHAQQESLAQVQAIADKHLDCEKKLAAMTEKQVTMTARIEVLEGRK